MENHYKNPKTREELIKLLKDIANDETVCIDNGLSAMCYSTSYSPFDYLNCNTCEKDMLGRMSKDRYSVIQEIANNICEMGYDAKVEMLCIDCLINKLESDNFIYDLNNFEYTNHTYSKHKTIPKKNLNEDCLKKELRDACIFRARDKTIYTPLVCFYFRLNQSEKYHLVQANDIDYYKITLSYLKDERIIETITGDQLLRDNIDIIEKMTGLKID